MILTLRWRIPERAVTTRWAGPEGMLDAVARNPATAIAAIVGVGGGGSNSLSVGLATAIGTLTVPADVGVIRTSGYAAAGKGAAAYVSDALANASLAASLPRVCKQSADGRFWRLLPDPAIGVTQVGASGDGETDDYQAIQAALDYAQTFSSATVDFPAGYYIVRQTPQLTDAAGINLRGEGPDATAIVAGAFPAFKTTG